MSSLEDALEKFFFPNWQQLSEPGWRIWQYRTLVVWGNDSYLYRPTAWCFLTRTNFLGHATIITFSSALAEGNWCLSIINVTILYYHLVGLSVFFDFYLTNVGRKCTLWTKQCILVIAELIYFCMMMAKCSYRLPSLPLSVCVLHCFGSWSFISYIFDCQLSKSVLC